jgi:hypothetical protein
LPSRAFCRVARQNRGVLGQIFGSGHGLSQYTDVLLALGDRIREINDPEALAFAAAELLGQALAVSRAGYGTIDTQSETITIERDWNAPGISWREHSIFATMVHISRI